MGQPKDKPFQLVISWDFINHDGDFVGLKPIKWAVVNQAAWRGGSPISPGLGREIRELEWLSLGLSHFYTFTYKSWGPHKNHRKTIGNWDFMGFIADL